MYNCVLHRRSVNNYLNSRTQTTRPVRAGIELMTHRAATVNRALDVKKLFHTDFYLKSKLKPI